MPINIDEIFDSKLRKQIIQISIATIILFVIFLIKPQINGKYIVNEQGELLGIEQKNNDEYTEYNLIANISKDNDSFKQNVKIHRQKNRNIKRENKEKNFKAEMSANLDYAIDKLEESSGNRIMLPLRLEDGSSVRWEKSKDFKNDLVIIPIIYFFLILSIVISKYDAIKKKENTRKEEILKYLPRFTNQLLLMMSSGVILNDAFKKICDGYNMCRKDKLGILEKSIIEITESAKITNQSIALLFTDIAKKYSVKELIRISTVLAENEKRGSNVQEKLERESMYLWDMRKSIARERGKLIDTKMTYPLGMLLVLLIVITMAPAMMIM